jgi:uncharacterized membrane protein
MVEAMMHGLVHGSAEALTALYLLFLPGFFVSFLFFARGATDIIERVALSFALSVAIVPLLVFYLNVVGVKIRTWTVIAEVAFVIIVSLVAGLLTKRWEKPHAHEHKKRG